MRSLRDGSALTCGLPYWKARLELAREFELPDEQQEALGFIRVLDPEQREEDERSDSAQ